MAVHYHHTQQLGTSTLMGALLVAPRIWESRIWACLRSVLLGASALPFSSLTVEVSDTEIRWYFGQRGVWDYRVALSDIEGVRIVRITLVDRLIYGFGVEHSEGGYLYNVSGSDAVELRLKTGRIRRIETDDPQGLAAALKSSGPA